MSIDKGDRETRTSISRYYRSIISLREASLDIALKERADVVFRDFVNGTYMRLKRSGLVYGAR